MSLATAIVTDSALLTLDKSCGNSRGALSHHPDPDLARTVASRIPRRPGVGPRAVTPALTREQVCDRYARAPAPQKNGPSVARTRMSQPSSARRGSSSVAVCGTLTTR